MTRTIGTILFACTLAAGSARAYDSGLDLGFSDGTLHGWSKPYFDVGGYPSEHLAGMFRDADGHYLLIGKVCTSAQCATFDIGIARLLGSGAFDTSYGTNGYVRTPQDLLGNVTAVARDSHGRFVVVGPTAAGAAADVDFGVLRLLPDGSYDSTFAYAPPPLGTGGGRKNIDFGLGGGSNDYPADVLTSAAAAGDYIYLVGQVSTPAGSDVGLALLTPSGQLDGGFGSGGLAHFNFGSDAAPLLSTPTSLAFGDNLLVAGVARQNGGDPQFALASYYSDGHGFDITFCSNGMCGGGNTGRMLIPATRDATRPFNDLQPRVVVENNFLHANIYLGGTVIGYAPGSSDLDSDVYIRGFDHYGRDLPGFPDFSFQGISHGWLNRLAVDPTSSPPVSSGLSTHRLVYAGTVTDGNGGGSALVGRFLTGNSPGPDLYFAPGSMPYVTLTTPHHPGETHLEGTFSTILFDGPHIVLGGDTYYCCSNTTTTNYDFVAARLIDDAIFADGFDPSA
ncbi:hypothetical protein [Dokdonella sp.]|uniref:hypothetical protein n=1 Tax=Dokdonella sp. TaxID=2291710 RepID=UPI001B0CC979|nr:hypothetical protein [Dokdonella sp.]MBO9662460.1 hypothetical protein [Dokdonella sp.]